jgi:hypothetical protein
MPVDAAKATDPVCLMNWRREKPDSFDGTKTSLSTVLDDAVQPRYQPRLPELSRSVTIRLNTGKPGALSSGSL